MLIAFIKFNIFLVEHYICKFFLLLQCSRKKNYKSQHERRHIIMLICVALKWLQFVSKSEFSPFYTVIKNTNRSGFNVFISNGLKCLGSGNTSGLTILRIKMRITLKRTGTRISAIVCILWRY